MLHTPKASPRFAVGRLTRVCRSIRRATYSNTTTDYRCEDGRFFGVREFVITSNPDLLSISSETGINARIRSWKGAYQMELNVRKPLVVSISQRREEPRLDNLV
jgi:hypothetical protein